MYRIKGSYDVKAGQPKGIPKRKCYKERKKKTKTRGSRSGDNSLVNEYREKRDY